MKSVPGAVATGSRTKMIDRMQWIKRQFSFDLPLGIYANVVERVRGTPARLEDLTRGLSREILTLRDGDQWSIQEQAGHLLDLEPLGMNRLDDFEAGRETLAAADMQNRKTHEGNHNVNTIENILTAFRKERMEFVRRLDAYDEAFVQRTALHPRLKVKIRVIDLVFFIAEHDDHHLARISELKRLFGAQRERQRAISSVEMYNPSQGSNPMAQELNNLSRTERDTVADHFRNELMKESLRKAEEIRRGLEGRKHSDSTVLVSEDRKR